MTLKSRNIDPSTFQRGTASASNKLVPPSAPLSALQALPRTEGALYYATDEQIFYYDDGTTLSAIDNQSGQIDGGDADSIYGGTPPFDGGGA